ncbi:9660_t:CDS:1 [Funneliformis geosporum]|nr:9660_t:CDS:1 [Funneliformis geosporum]
MKSSNLVADTQGTAFNSIMHHDFYDLPLLNQSQNPNPLLSSSIPSLTSSANISDESEDSKRLSTSSVFEKYAQTPRHFTKETEVLGKVGRFTIVREREDFDTTYFDQCHCQQKPCRLSLNGGTHPILEPELLGQFPFPYHHVSSHPISIPMRHNSLKGVGVNNGGVSLRSSTYSQHLTQQDAQQFATIAYQQMQMQMNSNNRNSCPSISSSKSSRSFYCQHTPTSTSSRRSLPSLQKQNGVINVNNNTNSAWPMPMPIIVSKVASAAAASPSVSCRGVLPQSASSPNLVHLHQRSKGENMCYNKSTRINSRNINIIIGGKHSNPQSHHGSYYYPHCPSSVNSNTPSLMLKTKKSSLINMKATQEQQRRSSIPPPLSPTTSTPTTPSKLSFSHHQTSNEPHTTINSHSGRKFEVEWTTKTSSSTSSTSSTSSETASSPSSTISSLFSMASSPSTSVNSTTSTLSRQCSTLSSKCGRKFEVTVLSSNPSSNGLINTSPHSTTKC